jgi:hypothetical protein
MFLGAGGFNGGLWVPVVNVSTDAIVRGTLVSFKSDADRTYATTGTIDRSQASGLGPTHLIPVTPWVTSTDDNPFGVVLNGIPSGGHGLVCIIGCVYIRTDGSVAAGDALVPTTGGIADTYVASGTKFGKALFDDWTDETELDYGSPSNTWTLAIVRFTVF